MAKNKKDEILYLIILIAVTAFGIAFVTMMGFLNYRTSAIELEEKVILRMEEETVAGIETAINFGKSFENYFGMEEVFASFHDKYAGTQPFIISRDAEVLYLDNSGEQGDAAVTRFLSSDAFAREFASFENGQGGIIKNYSTHAVFTPVHQEEEVIGYFGTIYSEGIFAEGFTDLKRKSAIAAVIVLLAVCAAFLIFNFVSRGDRWKTMLGGLSVRKMEKGFTLLIMAVGILSLSGISLYFYQQDYRSKIEGSITKSLLNLEENLDRVREQGVDLRDVDGLKDYIRDRVQTIETLSSVRVTERISEVRRTNEKSDLIVFEFGSGQDSSIYLEAEISNEAVDRQMRNILLILLSTMIILLIFVLEMNNMVDLLSSRGEVNPATGKRRFSEKQVSLALRFTGFLCLTAEYMCVPYAAMMIREHGESLFGLSVGVTAALPLTVEGLTQMIAMLTMPRMVKKVSIKKVLFLSGILMIAGNVFSFTSGTALVIVVCRGLAGVAYAGFKQVSNYLITRGYETEEGRSENISQDNAGLLAGATCGAGLGAILSANAGYSMTFLFSACFFAAYLIGTFLLVPWAMMAEKTGEEEGDDKPVRAGDLLKMFLSPEMLYFIVVIGIPLNIGVMLCVTLIPAICQTKGISSVLLSYCYIANGLAGIYLGPALVSAAKKRFGLKLSIAFAFGLTAAGIFILHIPPVALMIVISSMALGFLDGFGTPMVTDQFMSLKVVSGAVNESTSLIFYSVLSYALLTFAPMIAELMVLPANGGISPMMIGAIAYAAAAVLVLFIRSNKKAKA